jgi:hypothetical protein
MHVARALSVVDPPLWRSHGGGGPPSGGGGGGCALDASKDDRWFGFDVTRSDPKHLNAPLGKPPSASRIVFHLPWLIMDRTINLHAKPDGRAVEVEDVRPDRMLPAKAQAALVAAEQCPQLRLGRRHSPA